MDRRATVWLAMTRGQDGSPRHYVARDDAGDRMDRHVGSKNVSALTKFVGQRREYLPIFFQHAEKKENTILARFMIEGRHEHHYHQPIFLEDV